MTEMSFQEFESAAKAQGCEEVLARQWPAHTVLETHTHPFTAKALVVQGELWLTVGDQTQHLRVGDRFGLASGTPHSERYGAEGATYWVARHPGA